MTTHERTLQLCGYCGQPSPAGIHDHCYHKAAKLAEPKSGQWRQRNLACHQGFVCELPPHAGVTLARFYHRYNMMAEQTDLPVRFKKAIDQQMDIFKAGLGFGRDRVEVPETERLPFPDSIEFLDIPLENGPLGPSYRAAIDNDEQVRRKKLCELEVCPFGLDCIDPGAAVGAVWAIFSIIRFTVAPWLIVRNSTYWDTELYEHLANTVELLGLLGHSKFIGNISTEKHKTESGQFWDSLRDLGPDEFYRPYHKK